MPGMNGLELAEYLRKTDNTIPVIIMTGFPSIDNTIKLCFLIAFSIHTCIAWLLNQLSIVKKINTF